MANPARIIFAGTPEFAVLPLQALLASQHDVVAVYTQPDRPAGRGRKLVAGPVKQAALDAGLPVCQPRTLKDTAAQQQLAALDADLMVVVAYGLLLPAEVLSAPRLGCINLHASLLPRWRGASPMQMAILHGDPRTGVCIMQMDEGLDTGPVLATASLDIGPHETVAELHDRLAQTGANLLSKHLKDILAGQLEPVPQPEAGVTYAHRIKKSDGQIDWDKPAAEIDRQIRAYAGWPVAYTQYHGQQLRCWMSDISDCAAEPTAAPGAIVQADSAGLHVQTGDGVLVITRLQLAGRRQIDAGEFERGKNLHGLVLGNNP